MSDSYYDVVRCLPFMRLAGVASPGSRGSSNYFVPEEQTTTSSLHQLQRVNVSLSFFIPRTPLIAPRGNKCFYQIIPSLPPSICLNQLPSTPGKRYTNGSYRSHDACLIVILSGYWSACWGSIFRYFTPRVSPITYCYFS